MKKKVGRPTGRPGSESRVISMTITLTPALRETLEEMAGRNLRSVSAQATLLMEAGLKALDETGGNPIQEKVKAAPAAHAAGRAA